MNRIIIFSLGLGIQGLTGLSHSEESFFKEDPAKEHNQHILDACIANTVKSAPPESTVKQLRDLCSKNVHTPTYSRVLFEEEAKHNPFAILPHKPNYILPFTQASANEEPYEEFIQDQKLDNQEAKFQISIKFLAAEGVWTPGLNVNVAFTAISWWQTYNKEVSAPFRETNYEPELFLSYTRPWSLLGMDIIYSSLSINHQSNGQSGSLSRSWNRIIGTLGFNHGNLLWSTSAWYRLPEDEKENAEDTIGDDNPDIEKYLGYGEFAIIWKLPRTHNLDAFIRNNLRSENKGSIELGWSFPLTNHLRGYVQYFNGYGESLIDYNHSTERFGIGVKLTDWL